MTLVNRQNALDFTRDNYLKVVSIMPSDDIERSQEVLNIAKQHLRRERPLNTLVVVLVVSMFHGTYLVTLILPTLLKLYSSDISPPETAGRCDLQMYRLFTVTTALVDVAEN